jgi:hypothetical protein
MIEKEIPGYRGAYVADENGEVWSLRRNGRRKLTRSFSSGDGWARVTLQPDSGDDRAASRSHTAASLILTAFAGPRPSSRHRAHHINDDSADDRPSNLEWATLEEVQAARVGKALRSVATEEIVAGLTRTIQDIQEQKPTDVIAHDSGLSPHVIRALRSAVLGLTVKRGRSRRYRKSEQVGASELAPVQQDDKAANVAATKQQEHDIMTCMS